jgi:hypothetical protein
MRVSWEKAQRRSAGEVSGTDRGWRRTGLVAGPRQSFGRPGNPGWLLALGIAGSALAVASVHTVTLCIVTYAKISASEPAVAARWSHAVRVDTSVHDAIRDRPDSLSVN